MTLRRALAAFLMLAFVAGAARPAGAYIKSELKPWPGAGFRTDEGSWMRPLDPRVTFTPLLTVGDSLLAPSEDLDNFLFYPAPDGIGVRSLGRGLAEIDVAHNLSWEDGLGGSRISRLLYDEEERRLLSADWVVDGVSPDESFQSLGSVSIPSTREGVLIPNLIVNEGSTDGSHHGVAAAVNLRSGQVTSLPWLGRMRHGATVLLPMWGGRLVAIITENATSGASRLFMYIADSDADFLSGRGQLHVFRADPPDDDRPDTQSAAMTRKTRAPLKGRFVPIGGLDQSESQSAPFSLEAAVEAARGCRFVRLGDVAPDRRNPGAFYFADQGDENLMDPVSGRPVTGDGRVYRVELDSFDPTIVREMRVILDGDDEDDLYRPRDLETDMKGLWIQEDPQRRGIHPSRLLRWDFDVRKLDVLAECAERDPQGRMIPAGTGGLWRTCGIVDASDAFGANTWLLAVQGRNDRSTMFDSRGGGGQLLLVKWTDRPEEKKKKDKKEKR